MRQSSFSYKLLRLDSHLPTVLSLALGILGTLGAKVLAQTARPIRLQSQVTHVQPMTGIVLWSDNEKLEQYSKAISLEYRYCGYNEVVDSEGRYDWSKIDQVLDEIAGRNHQAVLRFYFVYVGKRTTVPDSIRQLKVNEETTGLSEKKETYFCDWRNADLQYFTLEFYSRFADRYDHDPRLAFLQTGFGLWAEYHIYSGPRIMGRTFPSKDFQERFLRHLDEQFESLPWSISIDAADYDYTPLEDNQELLGLGFGLFDDSFLCKPHPKENAINWQILGPQRWQRQPGGGEFSYYNMKDQKKALSEAGPNGVSFERAAEQFHISYMIGNDQTRFQPVERIESASRATGYRFRVTAAAIQGQELRLRVTNDGCAPIYRDAYFAAGSKRSPVSLKGLLPGQHIVCPVQGITENDVQRLHIHCDAILPTQRIEFEANL